MLDHSEAPPAPAPAAGTPTAGNEKLPPLPLAAAGLTALNAMLTIASVGLYVWASAAATPILQRAAPWLVFLGVAAVTAGAVMMVKNKRSGFTMPGTVWAAPAIVAGLALMTAAVFLPLVYALSLLVDEGR